MIFEESPWFIPLCLFLGAVYAYVLYKPKGPWSPMVGGIMAISRFFVVSLLAFLLIGPIIRQIKNSIEAPVVVFLIDNSSSLKERTDSVRLNNILKQVEDVREQLESDGFNTQIRTFGDEQPSKISSQIKFDYASTDLNQLLDKAGREFEGRNLAACVLVSDGIYNSGISPAFTSYGFEVFPVGIGDTIPRKDLLVKNVIHNQISYQGNIFPVTAEIANQGFDDQITTVSIKHGGKVIQSQPVKLSSREPLARVDFKVDANEQGLQHYEITVAPVDGELTYKNNSKQAYVDIVAGKEKILIIAAAPHPDIKAIRSALDKNQNYETLLYIPGISDELRQEVETGKFDLVIFYQVPDARGLLRKYYEQFVNSDASVLTIVGPTTNLSLFNAQNGLITLQNLRFQPDQVTAYFNTLFTPFQLSEKLQKMLSEYPPVIVPFGRIQNQVEHEVYLYQKVGKVETTNPMLLIEPSATRKRAIMLGTGFWRWNLNEYLHTEDHSAFDELISKLVQYLSSREDKRKFKVYPVNPEFTTSEGVDFETEIYDDLFERIYNLKVDLTITGPDGKKSQYSYVPTETQSQYTVRGLNEGIYKYTARVEINGSPETANGEFLVKELELENLNLTADFGLLRNLAHQSGGSFFEAGGIENISNTLNERSYPGIIHSSEAYLPLINLKFNFFVLLLLITFEWFNRKYQGSY